MNTFYIPKEEAGLDLPLWWWLAISIIVILVLVWLFFVYIQYKKKQSLRLFLKHSQVPHVMKGLTPESFELWTQGLFINIGADAVLSKRESKTGFDHGIDLIVKYKGQKICVQCKKYFPANLVDETKLRDLYGTMNYGNFDKAILVTTSSFTTRSIRWAAGTNKLILINGELLQKIRNNSTILISLLNQ